MSTEPSLSDPPEAIDPVEARKWRPFASGPREQWLRCEGNLLARVVSLLHYLWPSDRGQWRFTRFLGSSAPLRRLLSNVPFRSQCGVTVSLDIPTDQFLFLSGRLSPEPLELAIVSRVVKPGDVFVDVGAHWGLYILHVLGRLGTSGRYFAIEPSHSNFRFLEATFSATDQRLERLELAISDVDGHGRLADEGDVNAHLCENEEGSIEVSVARLDTVLCESGLRAGRVVIKVDTEGHESAVVRGCLGLAQAGIKPVFMLEFLLERFGQTRAGILKAIEETFGPVYTFWAVDHNAGCLVRFEDPSSLGDEIRNIIAVPPESIDRLAGCPCTAPTS